MHAEVVEAPQPGSPLAMFWAAHANHRDADPGFARLVAATASECRGIRLLHVEAAGQTRAIAVGRLERARLPARLGRWNLPVPALEVLTLIHGGLMGAWDDAAAAAGMAALERLLAAREADAVMLHAAPVSHPLTHRFIERPGMLRDCGWRSSPLYSADIALLAGDFMASLNANSRRKERQRERKLRDAFGDGFRLEEFRDETDIPRLMRLAETVMQHNYQRGLGVGFVHGDAARDRLLHSARAGWLRAWVVWCGAEPGCFWIGDLRRGIFHSDYLAYDQRLADFSPGRFLTVAVMQHLAERQAGVASVDFGMGEAEWKERLSSSRDDVATVHLFAPYPAALVTNLARRAAAGTTAAAKTVLERLGAFDTVRRRLRRSGRQPGTDGKPPVP